MGIIIFALNKPNHRPVANLENKVDSWADNPLSVTSINIGEIAKSHKNIFEKICLSLRNGISPTPIKNPKYIPKHLAHTPNLYSPRWSDLDSY